MMTRSFVLAACLGFLALPVLADDWPQWRGPNRDGVSKETGLLKKWPDGGPKVSWTYDAAGTGYSSVAVVGDTLYTVGAAKNGKEFILALDIKNGKKLWSTEYADAPRLDRGAGPRGTPTIDGGLLFVIGSQGDLVCVDTAKGTIKWQKNLPRDFKGQMMSGWGWAESPLVDGDRLICTPGGKDGSMVALNKDTGELIWRSKGISDRAAYCSVVPATIAGVKQYVQLSDADLYGVSPENGEVLWKYARRGTTAVATTPVVDDDYIFITSAYNAPCNCVQVTRKDKTFDVKEVYVKSDVLSNHHGGVVRVGDYIYGYNGGNDSNRTGKWVCLEMKSGEVKWKTGVRDKHPKGSLVAADGLLYLYSEGDGEVAVIEATPEGWKEVGRMKLPKHKEGGKPYWAHPVVANGKLFLRDQDTLFCFDIKDGSSTK